MALRFVVGFAVIAIGASDPCRKFPYPNHAADTFVHLFEWTWKDIAKECEVFLGPKKFTGVQISPPNDHMAGSPWYTRYQPVTYNLTSRSGTEAEFKDMVDRCNKVGVRIYVDLVLNHVAAGAGRSIMGHPYGGRRTPIYEPNDFHHSPNNNAQNCGISNYADKYNVQYCDLLGLPDLCTACGPVRARVQAYIQKLESLGVAGFRIDAAKHMDVNELHGMLGGGRGCFYFMEVIDDPHSPWQLRPTTYRGVGKVTDFNFREYLSSNIIQMGKLPYLRGIAGWGGLVGGGYAVTFIENHDTQRTPPKNYLQFGNVQPFQMAMLWLLALPYGYPKILSSYYWQDKNAGPPNKPVHKADGSTNCGGDMNLWYTTQHPWVCEHRWTAISNMVAWRKTAGSGGESWWKAWNFNQVGYCRSWDSACIVFNRAGSAHFYMEGIKIPRGRCYQNIICPHWANWCQKKVCVDGNGNAHIYVPGYTAVAFHKGAMAEGTEEEEKLWENMTLVVEEVLENQTLVV